MTFARPRNKKKLQNSYKGVPNLKDENTGSPSPYLIRFVFLAVRQVTTFVPRIALEVCLFVFGATAPPPSGPGSPHSRGFYITHNDAPQSVRLLWTSDQLVAETSTWQYITQQTDIHAPCGIRTHNLSRRAAADLCLRPRGHWDRPALEVHTIMYRLMVVLL